MRGGRGSTACCPSVQKCKSACGLCKGAKGGWWRLAVGGWEHIRGKVADTGGGWRPRVAGGGWRGFILRSRVSAIGYLVQGFRYRCRYGEIDYPTAIR